MQTKKIELKRLRMNKGQIEGLPANPRKWTNADLEKLMEYDPVYCDVIIHRWETFTGQKAKRIER
jgi:hypothetical protein